MGKHTPGEAPVYVESGLAYGGWWWWCRVCPSGTDGNCGYVSDTTRWDQAVDLALDHLYLAHVTQETPC